MILNRLPDDVTILQAVSTVDEYGNAVKGIDPTVGAVTKGFLQPEQGSGGESTTAERNSVSSYFRLYLPAGTNITARDQVQIDGITYRVEGDPIKARNLQGPSHIKARLRKLEG